MVPVIVPQSEKTKPKWVVPFKLGGQEHKGFVPFPGTDWTVEIPLVGDYVAPDSRNFDKFVERLEEFIIKNNLPFHPKDKVGHGGYARSSVGSMSECVPVFPNDNPLLEALYCWSIGAWWADDLCDTLGRKSMEDAKFENVCLDQLSRKVWSGVYSTPDEFLKGENYSEALAELYPAIILWHHGQKLASQSIPNFGETLEWFHRSYSEHIEAMRFISQPIYSDHMSIEAFRYLRGFDVAFEPVLEFCLAMFKVNPQPKVRNHLLFRLISNLMRTASGIVNDLVSLGRDLASNKKHNYVLILVKEEGITLTEAINKSVEITEKLVSDIEFSGKQLIQEFGSDAEILKFWEIWKNVWNASVTCYSTCSRYGSNACGRPFKK